MTVGARQPDARRRGDDAHARRGQPVDPRGLPTADRAGEHRSPLGLPRLQPPLSHRGVASLGGLRDRDRAGQRGGRAAAPRPGDLDPVPSADRRHPEQATGLSATAWRILATIVRQSIRLRPHRPLLLILVPCAILAVTVHWAVVAAGGLIVMALWSLFLIDLRSRHREIRKESYGFLNTKYTKYTKKKHTQREE